MKEYYENFDYNTDAEDEDSISFETFLEGYYSNKYEKYSKEPECRDLITQVFTDECSAMTFDEAIQKLIQIIDKAPKRRRAIGSLGGSVRSGYLKLDEETGLFIKTV